MTFNAPFDKSAAAPKRRVAPDQASNRSNQPARQQTTIQNLFVLISEHELEIEKLRQRLVRECPEFNTVDAFRLLDADGTGEVSKEQLMQTLAQDIGAEYTEAEIDLFFWHFDKEQKGCLRYSEFCEAFKPKSQQVVKELEARKPTNLKKQKSYSQLFSVETQFLCRHLWEQLFVAEMAIESERQLLLKNPYFDVQKAFRLFESNDDLGKPAGFITRDDLLRTLMLDDPHTDILFQKFHRRQQGIVTYAEFIEEVSPKGPLL